MTPIGTVLTPRKFVALSTAFVMWFVSISGSCGVVVAAVDQAVACAADCMARFCACSDSILSQTTIGIDAAMARSLAMPCHICASDARLAASSSACVSREIANASHPAAACIIGATPAPACRRDVLISGGNAPQMGGMGIPTPAMAQSTLISCPTQASVAPFSPSTAW